MRVPIVESCSTSNIIVFYYADRISLLFHFIILGVINKIVNELHMAHEYSRKEIALFAHSPIDR
jgi:hypothetical protein